MCSEEPPRKLRLTFAGEGLREGNVPLAIVASRLEALQALVYHAAATVQGDRGARRGLWTNRYRDFAELYFHSSHSSALTIEAELPSPGPILSPEFDRGARAVDLVFRFGRFLEETPGDLDQVVRDRQEQSFLLRGIEALCPALADAYEVQLENCTEEHPRLIFTGATRQKVRTVFLGTRALAPQEQEEATAVGTLIIMFDNAMSIS